MTTIIFDMSLTYICVAFGGVLLNNLVVEAVPLPARCVKFSFNIAVIRVSTLM